jgi:uncharacterized membrane protein
VRDDDDDVPGVQGHRQDQGEESEEGMSSLNVALNHLSEPYRSEVVEEIDRMRFRMAELVEANESLKIELNDICDGCDVEKKLTEAEVLRLRAEVQRLTGEGPNQASEEDMNESQTKDRLIEEMRENERLRGRVAELESDRDRYKRVAESLSRVLGAYSKNLSDGFEMDRINTTLRTAEAWLRWAMGGGK